MKTSGRIKAKIIDYTEVNAAVNQGAENYISRCEDYYKSQIDEICEELIGRNSKIILLAGPSSSGKTTTAARLCAGLEKRGRSGQIVSIDDFYIDRDKLPPLPDGSLDLETIEAIDVSHLRFCLDKLLNDGRADFPVFDFHRAKRLGTPQRIECGTDHVIIVEGIHALNPLIVQGLDESQFFRLFISVASFYLHNEGRILLDRYELRLIRRVIRDFNYRNSTLEKTVSMWKSVRIGEKKYISPFKPLADYFIDSLLFYEPGMFRTLFEPLFEAADKNGPYYGALESLYNQLELFDKIPVKLVPEDSLLREFI
ncbi:MAG: hypothetical protein LBC56_08115 [Oscillospiraceae bacterium]|nr:hypothetical protein [Oscillospiraceae bacterium]